MTWYDTLADFLDKLRIIPRVLIICYMASVGFALNWYFDFDVRYVKQCDSAVMQVVLKEVPGNVKLAESIACTNKDVIAQPLGYTALMATLVGAGSVIFGFYVNSGRRDSTPGTN